MALVLKMAVKAAVRQAGGGQRLTVDVLATRVKVSPRSLPEVTNQDQPDSREGSLSALFSYSADR
jgi:hypothetical protein